MYILVNVVIGLNYQTQTAPPTYWTTDDISLSAVGAAEEGYAPQNLLYGDGSITDGDIKKTITFGVNLTVNKIDSLTGDVLPGTKFKVQLTNVSAIDGYQLQTSGAAQNPPSTVYVTTDSNGQIKLTGILPSDFNSAITATITEVGVPTASGWYYKVNSTPVNITITHSSGNWSATGGGATVSGDTVSLTITNQPYINLSGNVWQDAQTGEKNVAGPNGTKDSGEANLQGVEVQLYSVKTASVIRNTTTDSNGNYSFNDIPRTLEGFKIIFKYNGITYVETPQGTVSKPTEIERTAFNNRFKTISRGQSNDGTALTYTYNSNNKTSALNATIAGHTTGTADAKFQMKAQTAAYNTTASDIHCGLVKKNFDLAIGTDVKSAKLKLNGKETTYSYAQIMDGVLDFQNSSSSKENVVYNLCLYLSDYNYRIDDYKSDIKTSNAVNSEKPEGGYTETEGNANTSRLKELEVYVTYNVILKSQTTKAITTSSTVEQFVYYYDSSVYTPQFKVNDIVDGYKVTSIQGNTIVFDSTATNNALTEGNNYRKEVNLEFKVNKDGNNNIILKENVTNIAEITKYSTSEGGLIDKDSAPANGISNGRIAQYEDDTDEAKGLNIVLRENERTITGTVFEDANKDRISNDNKPVDDVTVQLIEIKQEDANRDGVTEYYEYIWQETKSGSNEVKTTARNGYTGKTYTNSVGENETGRYEFKDFIPGNYIIRYIYGDGTRVIKGQIAGQNNQPVAGLDVNLTHQGTTVSTVKTDAHGEYKFSIDNYVPGLVQQYQIKYNENGTEKTIPATQSKEYKDTQRKYNGQDYKSTNDLNYNKLWYNTADYAAGESIARDNEARRLEVMSYSTIIDGTIGTHLENKTDEALENTWMCAETSMVNIPVDEVEDAKVQTAGNNTKSTTASYDYTKNSQNIIFENMNFGLALRPQENIVLEKHITALKITPSGTGVQPVVDAKAKALRNAAGQVSEEAIQRIVNGDSVEVEGTTNGLAIIKSTKQERGFWQVATDVEELMQGAELEVEYTYVLRNDSEENYLSSTLIQAYEKQDVKPYKQSLIEIAKNTIKPSMRNGAYSYKLTGNGDKLDIGTYLGQFYYTGNKGANDKLVSARVEKFEEALNNDLVFDETEETDFKIARQASKENVYGVDKNQGAKETEINTVVGNTAVSKYITPKLGENHSVGTADWSRTIKLRTTLSTVDGGELGANLPSYIAEILQYSNAAGRKDMTATPANLGYVHSNDTRMTIESDNEQDEFWAETIIITKPTGDDKITLIQIVLISISAIAVLGVGIILIKKYVLKK